MPELLRVIQTMAQNESAVSVAELAELIQQDSTVLVKVIAAANTLGYNPSGVKIASVSQAIHVLGFAKVRRLAMSLLLMEHAGRASTPTEQREMAAISLCSGLIAQVAAEHMALVDPEQAFVCAALRNFGRLVLGTFMTTEFVSARQLAERDGNDDEAYREVFGLTPLELGYELLKSTALPESILHAIGHLPPEKLEQAAWAERRLAHLARFSLRLSELVLDPKYDAGSFGVASTELMHRYSAEIPALPELFPELLSKTEAQLRKIAQSAGGDSLDRYGLERLRRRVKGHDLPARPPTSFAVPANRIKPTAAAPKVSTMEEACDLLQRNAYRTDAVPLAIDAMHAALALDECFYCVLDAISGEFVLDYGHGQLATALRGKILFRRHERNVFLLCHARLENVVVRDATDAKLQAHLPVWLRDAAAPKSFVLLPVHHQGRVHGVILGGWKAPHPVQLPADRLALLRKMLALVARAALA